MNMLKISISLVVIPLLCLAGLSGLAQQNTAIQEQPQRIVSLNGAVSEMLCALGLEDQIVGVDITSNYPASLQKKPRVGHNINISAEGVLALNPTIVLGLKNQLTPQLQEQLRQAGAAITLFKQDYSIQGTRSLLLQLAQAVKAKDKGEILLQKFDRQIHALKISSLDTKVLFIYARGAGTMLVSGSGTSVDAIIRLAGARNAVQEFSDFKPLSAESLVTANPDVILMFDDGLKSIGGIPGLLHIPGIAQTTAGKNKKVITMEGELLSGFGLRLPQAIQELHDKISAE
jgi:iron complex transport system substrate-binding protein